MLLALGARGAPSPWSQVLWRSSRKPVNMTKATINYRNEKTHMMSAIDRSFTDQSTLQEDERLGLSFMDTHNYSNRGSVQSMLPTEELRHDPTVEEDAMAAEQVKLR
ncbi:UNVERIFIED_CONTAM: hypothetical protein K2H54_045935 [Gekko kuhli]